MKGNMSFGDTSKVQIQGKGIISISLISSSHNLVTNVYYVPKLKSNILSLGYWEGIWKSHEWLLSLA